MRLANVMNHTWAYRAWQAPFADAKLRPFLAQVDLERVRRVLDVGCGPGTNAAYFSHADYTGLDLNESYIADARRRHRRDFRVADVTRLDPHGIEPADLILVNSLLHHLDSEQVHRTLATLATLLTENGAVHILDLVRPERLSLARVLADLDRGPYARRLDEWRSLLTAHFVEQLFEPYTFAGGLWSMVYFQGGLPTRGHGGEGGID